MNIPKRPKLKLKHVTKVVGMSFWFLAGVILSIFFITSSIFLIFQKINYNSVYPGVIVNGINLGGMNRNQIETLFAKKNDSIKNKEFIFSDGGNEIATVSAQGLGFGYDQKLISSQAFSIGRSEDIFTNTYLILKAYTSGVYLPVTYKYSQENLNALLSDFTKNTNKKPIDALFKFENGRVTVFQPSEDGQEVDLKALNGSLIYQGSRLFYSNQKSINIPIPVTILKPAITTESINNFGIKELIGVGTSHFAHSIPSRIYNINLATSKFNGVLVAPDEIFSFDKVLGDVTAYTGYQQAYIIQNGRTILGDGGGVCQVSTTFFRAILNAGLPVVERHAHSYRVGYYEEDSPPGIDATVYYPSVDLKFKNDTGHYILIQTAIDPDNLELTFSLYGTRDGRTVQIGTPVVTNQTPPPPDLFQDDPTLPKGTVKQVDFAAWGADVYFTRQVSKDGKVIISDKFVSNYQPWQAIYLKGTQ